MRGFKDLDEDVTAVTTLPPADEQALGPTVGMQITDDVVTARKVVVPRTIGAIKKRIAALAVEFGDDWFYSFPVKNKDGTEGEIAGPSVRCIMAVVREYGNCRLSAIARDMGDHWIIVARFIDYETGFSLERPFMQRADQQTIRTKDKARARDIIFQIGVSKAMRNVGRNALPDIAEFAYELARENIVEKIGKKLPQYRDRVLARLKELNIDLRRVTRVVVKEPEQWVARDVAKLVAQIQSVADGESLPEDHWPPLEPTRDNGKRPEPEVMGAEGYPKQPEPTGEPVTFDPRPSFAVHLEDGKIAWDWQGKDAGEFADRMLNTARARRNDRDALDRLWDLNSHQWELMPEAQAQALRDQWRAIQPDPKPGEKPAPKVRPAAWEVILPDGDVIEAADEKDFLAKLLHEAGRLTEIGHLDGMLESNSHQFGRIKPANEDRLKTAWAELRAKLAAP